MVQPFIGEDRAGTGPRAFVGLRRRIPPLDLCEELPHFRILVELLYLVGQDLVSPDAPLDKSQMPFSSVVRYGCASNVRGPGHRSFSRNFTKKNSSLKLAPPN